MKRDRQTGKNLWSILLPTCGS